MSARAFEPKPMRLSLLTAALQELTPRETRDADPDRAIEDWLDFARSLDCPAIQLSAALHPSVADVFPSIETRTSARGLGTNPSRFASSAERA